MELFDDYILLAGFWAIVLLPFLVFFGRRPR